MLKLLLLFAVALFNLPAVAAAQDVHYSGDLAPQNVAPTFDNGYMVVWSYGPKIALYAPDGSQLYDTAIPGASWNAAVDTDGTLAAAVNMKKGGGIAVLGRNGAELAFINTTPFLPSNVCFGPDHSIWAIGRQARKDLGDTANYFILHEYSREGQELGAFLPSSSLPGLEAEPVHGGRMLRASGKSIGLFLRRAQMHNAEWLEVDWTGKLLGHWDTGRGWRPWAFTDGGKLYEQLEQGRIEVFDQATGKWADAGGMPGGARMLLAAEGDHFVFEIGNSAERAALAP